MQLLQKHGMLNNSKYFAATTLWWDETVQ